MSGRDFASARSHAETTTNAGLANSEGWIEWPSNDSQRRAPLSSTPAKRTASRPTMATASTTAEIRRTDEGVSSDAASMTTTPSAENATCRSTK